MLLEEWRGQGMQKLIRDVEGLNQGGEGEDYKQVVRFNLQRLVRN